MLQPKTKMDSSQQNIQFKITITYRDSVADPDLHRSLQSNVVARIVVRFSVSAPEFPSPSFSSVTSRDWLLACW